MNRDANRAGATFALMLSLGASLATPAALAQQDYEVDGVRTADLCSGMRGWTLIPSPPAVAATCSARFDGATVAIRVLGSGTVVLTIFGGDSDVRINALNVVMHGDAITLVGWPEPLTSVYRNDRGAYVVVVMDAEHIIVRTVAPGGDEHARYQLWESSIRGRSAGTLL